MSDPWVVPAGANNAGTTFSPSRIFDPKSYASGGAGMAGTADDFMRFLEAIRTGGAPILEPETAARASRNQIGDLPLEADDAGWRFGFLSAVLADPQAANTPRNAGTLDWGGVYGHRWWIDPQAELSVACYSNTALEGCNGRFRDETERAVYG
jgi:CubicO group peptidase (beta-lactamase class C family)